MPFDPSEFGRGLMELNGYMGELYGELDSFMGQLDPGAQGYSQVADADSKYRSALDGLMEHLSEGVQNLFDINMEGSPEEINRDILMSLDLMYQSAGNLFQILDPGIDATQVVNGLYSSQNIAEQGVNIVDPSIFAKGSGLITRYYIDPIEEIMTEAQQAQAA